MELSREMVTYLFEGMMYAEYRKLKDQNVRCRFTQEKTNYDARFRLQNKGRILEVRIGQNIDLVSWIKTERHLDDYVTSYTLHGLEWEDVQDMAKLLQEKHFSLLERPDITSEDLFPDLWETYYQG